MTGSAAGPGKGLALVSCDQLRVLCVMATEAQVRNGLGEVKLKFLLADFAHLVSHVTGVASHVEGGMTAALGGHVQALLMTAEAQVIGFASGCGLEQQVLIGRSVGIVTLDAILGGGGMNLT